MQLVKRQDIKPVRSLGVPVVLSHVFPASAAQVLIDLARRVSLTMVMETRRSTERITLGSVR